MVSASMRTPKGGLCTQSNSVRDRLLPRSGLGLRSPLGRALRAVRLVVDTGIHSKGWTRDQVWTSSASRALSTSPPFSPRRPLYRVACASPQLQARPAQDRELRERARKELGASLTSAASTTRCSTRNPPSISSRPARTMDCTTKIKVMAS